MKGFYGYIRVSTSKQGEGVSLQEQRHAISTYADRKGLAVVEWFEEKVTAAKMGRPGFVRMLDGLRRGVAEGVIIHKIDRSARNLRDWADLGDLIDAGVSIHFANESLDLRSRGGRLAADIQAIVAADFIRNNREEARKGLYGRLKQGLYPFQAPLGYLNKGKGALKEIDPVRGPLVRKAFELYAGGGQSLDSLVDTLQRLGLRHSNGRPVNRSSLSVILNNPFYTGLIRIRRNGQTYRGNHAPLVSQRLFSAVQSQLLGRLKHKTAVHDFTLRGVFHCGHCKRQLVGEVHKGIVYYRCHAKGCSSGYFREDLLEQALLGSWAPFAVADEWKQRLKEKLEAVLRDEASSDLDIRNGIALQLNAVQARLSRLTDALVDGLLDKPAYETRRSALLREEQELEQTLAGDPAKTDQIRQFVLGALELATEAQQGYQMANRAAKREMAIQLCSNRMVLGKEVVVEPYFPFQILRNRDTSCMVHHIGTELEPQLTTKAVKKLCEWAREELKRQRKKAA